MFGMNSQTVNDDKAAIDDYSQQLPVGGDDLIASGMTTPTDEPTQAQTEPTIVTPDQSTPQTDASSVGNDDLINIKKDALQQLTPLVDHLDQTPEERFRTTMMLIQATDDKSLLRSAYESATQIPDEKSKAQALLDVVNEINYFTHPEAQ